MTRISTLTGLAAAMMAQFALTLPALGQDARAGDSPPVAAPVTDPVIDPSIDINSDGFYSYPELQIVLPGNRASDFTAMDSSGDGLLDADEVAAALASGHLVLPQD